MIDEAILFQLITFNHFYGLSLSLSQTLFIDEMPSVGDELIGNFIDNVNLFVSRVLDRRMEHVHTIYMFFQQTFISPSEIIILRSFVLLSVPAAINKETR